MKNFILVFFIKTITFLPWPIINILGTFVGKILFHFNRREVNDARVNLKIAFPDMDEMSREHLLKRTICKNVITFFEMPKIWGSKSAPLNKVDCNGLSEKVLQLKKRNHGLILALPHHGNWEMVPFGLRENFNITALYRSPRMKILEPIMNKGRSRYLKMVSTGISGIKALHRALSDNEIIIILPDQVPKTAHGASVQSTFFGKESATMTLLSKLAFKHQAPVLMVWAERTDKSDYQIKFFEVGDDIRSANLDISVLTLNKAIENVIKTSPSQYQWSYRRYVLQNKDGLNPYELP